MAKQTISFACTSCGYRSVKWLGCCPSCNEWNQFNEINTKNSSSHNVTNISRLVNLDNIELTNQKRMVSSIHEWDCVIGGGIVHGSLLVLTGDPGIGKSTLLLQISQKLAEHHNVIYFSTEESLHQVRTRAERIGTTSNSLLFSDESYLENIIASAKQHAPDIVVIDSIQNCYLNNSDSTPGSINQLRESTFHLMRFAKDNNIAVIITGHITKEGIIAGPKALEHMVDAVFYLQGDERWQTRVLRSVKNRFGTINEIGFFEMQHNGLHQVPNINAQLLNEITHAPGSALACVMEGSRPLILELQALTIESKFSTPQRVVSGVDHKQVMLIAAILQKYLHTRFNLHDIFFKVTGGLSSRESTADLGIALALLSSYFQMPLPEKTIAIGEISLTGHIKPVKHAGTLIKEASKFGVINILLSSSQKIDNAPENARTFHHVSDLLTLFRE